jgi:N-acetylmuramoyl-L-alanine amidase
VIFPPFLVLAASLLQTKPTICIDPGHPSEVGLGTEGKHVTEIHVAWEVGKRLEKLLAADGYTVVMTKKSEMDLVKNKRRAEIANACHAGLMVRLHCDASNGTGFTTYFPDRQGSIDGFTGPDPELIKQIAPIAGLFHDTFKAALNGFLHDNGNHSDIKTAVGSKHGALVGSIYSKVPVVLVEMCVLTNPKDEEKVSNSEGLDRVAKALFEACVKTLPKDK